MIIKRTIKYSIQNQRNAGSRLRMRVSYNGCRVDFQTGIVLNKEYWDDVQQRVLPLNSNVVMATDLNDQLSQMYGLYDSLSRSTNAKTTARNQVAC